jgi:hypothetical protein
MLRSLDLCCVVFPESFALCLRLARTYTHEYDADRRNNQLLRVFLETVTRLTIRVSLSRRGSGRA